MQLYNTLTKTKEKLIPRSEKKIQMFVCGPTVYDYIHIGNARTFVFFDTVAKYLRSPLLRQGSEGHEGYEVDYIQNITDIDDKIIMRAKEAGREPLEYAKEYFERFKENMASLGVDSPRYIPATEHIEQVIKQVKKLIEKGHAYLIEGDGYYFDLSTFKDYGKLSGRKAQMADDAVTRIDENDKKKNRGDFCLWKFSKEGEPSWDSELGKGRPGWHIEDTAITEHYFGPQYDIHGGGQDLIFPHHEAEITQQESASGLKPFVKYWMHVAFLINKDEKMSKSKGNFTTAHDLLQKYPKEVLRFYLLSGYYRSPLEFSDKVLKQAEAGVNRISEFVQKLNLSDGNGKEDIAKTIERSQKQFTDSMDNDFNTPDALASLFEFIRTVNPFVTANSLDHESIELAKKYLDKVNSVLGVVTADKKAVPEEIQKLVNEREKFRAEKNYDESDKLRDKIRSLGYEIEDTIYGPLATKQ